MMRLLLLVMGVVFAFADVTLYQYSAFSNIKTAGKIVRESMGYYFAYDSQGQVDVQNGTQTQTFPTRWTFKGSTLLNDYIVKTHPVRIGSISYSFYKPHIFHYVLNVISNSSVNSIVLLTHNGEKLNIESTSKSMGKTYSIYRQINADVGMHRWDVFIAKGDDDWVCNCPSLGDGYVNTRYFFGWITTLEKEKQQFTFTNPLPIQYSVRPLLYLHREMYMGIK